jgi:transposase-like protein
MEAYVHGVSTRKVDDLVAALGIDTGISKSEVSKVCAELDAVVATFRGGTCPAGRARGMAGRPGRAGT